MRLLVTGATGFVGRHLVRRLSQHHELCCLVRRSDPELTQLGCSVIEQDLRYSLDLSALPCKIDAIIHLASVNLPFPEQAVESFQVVVAATNQLLDYGRRAGIRCFIYASSGSVYGFGRQPWKEKDPVQLTNFYAVNKYCAELLIKSYASYFSTCVLRLFFPYGPGQHGRRIPMIIDRIKQGKLVTLVNNGKPRINPIYIDDVIAIIQKALTLQGQIVVNVAGNQIVDMKELAFLIGDILGKNPVFEIMTDDTILDLIGDNQHMHQLFQLGTLVSLREGLERMIREYQS